jgi:hypothetical protein
MNSNNTNYSKSNEEFRKKLFELLSRYNTKDISIREIENHNEITINENKEDLC